PSRVNTPPDTPPNTPSLPAGAIIAITPDGFGLSSLLAERLKALGYQASLTQQLPPDCDVGIVLDALQPFASQALAIAANLAVFLQVKQIAPRFNANGGYLIVVEDTGGQFGFTECGANAVWAAGVSGLVKTAAQEWPAARCKVIDLQRADQTLERL